MNIALSHIKTLAAISTMAIMTACGGGSGGGGGTPATPTTPTTPTMPTPPVATGSVTRTAAGCSIAQKLGGFTDATLEIKDATWLQVVGQKVDDSSASASDKTLLAAEKDARVRIDVTAAAAGTALPADAKLQLAVTSGGTTTCEEFTLTSASAAAPTSVDYRTLDKSYVATIPAAKLKEGTISYQIVVHAADAAAAPKLYKQGSVVVSPKITDKIVIYPISFDGQTGSLPSVAEIKRLILRTMPHADVTITVAPATTLATLTTSNGTNRGSYYEFAGTKMRDALNDLANTCAADYPAPMVNESGELDPTAGPWQQRNKAEKCFGIYPNNVRFDEPGLALLANRTLLAQSFTATDDLSVSGPYTSHWLTSGARVLVHEYGHVLSLGHAKCGTTEFPDNWGGTYRLYNNGRLGPIGMGFDTRDGTTPYYFADSVTGTEFADMMSYCGKQWTSDRGYRAVIDYLGEYDGGSL